jgi:hypothetical protein
MFNTIKSFRIFESELVQVQSGTTQVQSGTTQVQIEPDITMTIDKSVKLPKYIVVTVDGADDELINKLKDELTLLAKKYKTKNIRPVSIKGFFNKEDTYLLKYTELIIQMNTSDIIKGTYTLDIKKNSNIKIELNDVVVFDLIHETYTENTLIDKIIFIYKSYLKNNNWKIT